MSGIGEIWGTLSTTWKVVIAIVALGLVGQVFKGNKAETKEIAAEKTPQQLRGEQIKNVFSAWDGSCPSLEKFIKKNMNDPDSYKHVSTRYIDKGDYLIVTTEFRGSNAFGGIVKQSVSAKVDLNGNLIEIL